MVILYMHVLQIILTIQQSSYQQLQSSENLPIILNVEILIKCLSQKAVYTVVQYITGYIYKLCA